MRRSSMLALIDATMSDLGQGDADPEEPTVFAGEIYDDMTEVNLDLEGALESVVEETRQMRAASGSAIPFDFARVEIKQPTVRQRRPSIRSWAGDLSNLVEEEFEVTTEEQDLPMLASGEFVAVPATDDLVPPARGRPVRSSRSLIAPEPPVLIAPLSKVPLAAKGLGEPVRVIVGTPLLAMHQPPEGGPARPTERRRAAFSWASALALWAATMAGVWVCRTGLYELIGL